MKYLFGIILMFVLLACESKPKYVLPHLGHHEIATGTEAGFNKGDTIFDFIEEEFQFLTQDSLPFTNKDLEGKISIAKFFFTHCPTICPPMTGQMDKLAESTKDIADKLQFLSFSIDPERDTVNRLRVYMDRHGITANNWFFLTGEKEAFVHHLGTQSFFINAINEPNAEGGYAHSPHFILVDRTKHVRGVYDVLERDGKGAENLKRLERDIRRLLNEEYDEK
ncbi:protein SCO1/2 [Lishizhenia tianjinensis]|uniref:Protein SCO1/2 n=1 Tax=Lishizhenia tianjinensis TaxID=477690 RepID=A0A1I7AYM3_9FLAO|nr:SCO family protein [Lishizhenia tianjinensis]SFT80015.1 protein SCO1/2 [Lishizhenia tianjinensis]